MITIREATEKDASSLIALRKSLFSETKFLLLEPEEYNPTEEKEAQFIKSFSKADNCIILLAMENDSRPVGFMGVAGGTTNRTKHKANIFMGILKESWGKGIGKNLFSTLLVWAQQQKLIRLELTTAINNERAFSLYKNMGFEVEGIKRKNILVDNEPIDEYQMCYIVP